MANTQESGGPHGERVVIKKYANRRLYNTQSSSYVTLEHLADMVKRGVDFVVYDAKTGDDITRTVLTQIIFEEESTGKSLLPIQFLRQLIGFYGDSMQAFLPSYLELSLSTFAEQQEQFRKQMSALGQSSSMGVGPAGYQEQIRQNLALFDRAMKMFSPFNFPPGADPRPQPATTPTPSAQSAEPPTEDALTELRRRMEEMQAQIEKLASKG